MNAFTTIGCALFFSACFSPEDRFNDFIALKKSAASDAGGEPEEGGAPGEGEPLTAEQVTGTYLYAISTPIDPTHPIVYLAEFEASPGMGDALAVRLRQRPLSITDRQTPVGEFSDWIDAAVEPTGTYQTPPITTEVPAAANTFGLPLTATVQFEGTFRNPATPEMPQAKVEFFCGTAMGKVEGVGLSLDGSTFAASRIPNPDDPSTYPEVLLNCSKQPAAPL